jgi:hypothetical protein
MSASSTVGSAFYENNVDSSFAADQYKKMQNTGTVFPVDETSRSFRKLNSPLAFSRFVILYFLFCFVCQSSGLARFIERQVPVEEHS